jgi:hypothetical protein
MKGQAHLMEYVLLGFFAVLIIVVVTFFLTGWQISTTSSEQRNMEYARSEFLLRSIANSPYLNKNTFREGSMLEDSKLTSITCGELQSLYGTGWYAEVESLEFKDTPCSVDTYPGCGKWSFCKEASKTAITFEIPVNIYMRTTGEIDAGTLRVGLYN